MFNHPSGSAAIEFCRKRQELENGTHKHLFFSSMKVFINNTMLPPLLIVKQISHTHLNHLNRIPATSLLLLLCTIVSLSRESGQTQASVKLKIEAKETVNFMLSAKNIIAMHCIVNFNHFQSPPATNNFYRAWKSPKKVQMQKSQKFCADFKYANLKLSYCKFLRKSHFPPFSS